MVYVYEAILSDGGDGWITAHIPALPGCVSQGRSISEVAQSIATAMTSYLETLILGGDPVPVPTFSTAPTRGERAVYVAATVHPLGTDLAGQTMTSAEAAQALGISVQRVAQLIHAGALSARKVGRDWVLDRSSVTDRQRHPVAGGRPVRLRTS